MGVLAKLSLLVVEVFLFCLPQKINGDDRGWYPWNADERVLKIHNELKAEVEGVYALGVNRSSNVAVFSIEVDGERGLIGSDFIFCSSDDVQTKQLPARKSFYGMRTNYEAPAFFLHQHKMLEASRKADLCPEMKKELEQYVKIIEETQAANVALGESMLASLASRKDAIEKLIGLLELKEGCYALSADLVQQFCTYLGRETPDSESIPAKNVHTDYRNHRSSLNRVFHSEQRILYYLLRDDGEMFKNLLKDVEKPKKIVLHLHTYKDPCPICGPVLNFSRYRFREIIREIYGSETEFSIVVSCSVFRDEMLPEEGLMSKTDVDKYQKARAPFEALLNSGDISEDTRAALTRDLEEKVKPLVDQKRVWWNGKQNIKPDEKRYPLIFLGSFERV